MRTIFDVIARDGASGPLGKVSASMNRMGASARGAQADLSRSAAEQGKHDKAMKASSLAMVSVGGGIALAGNGISKALDEARKVAGGFEYQLAGLKSVSNATADEMRAFEAAAKKAGVETQYAPTQAAAALQTLSQAGFNARQSVDLLRPSLDLAASSAGQLTVDLASSVIQQSIKGFGVQVRDAGMATDQMLKAVQMFAIDAGDLPLGLSNVSRGAQAMRQSFSESMITFGLVRNTISRVESAATAAGMAMERMTNKDVMANIKRQTGVDVAVGGKFKPFLDVVSEMIPKLQAMSEVKRANFFEQTFGSEGRKGIQSIFEQVTNGIQTQAGATLKGAEAIAYMREQMANAAGTASTFSNALLATSEGLDILWKGSIATASTSIGQAYAAIVDPIKRTALGALNLFIEAFEQMPGVAKQASVGFLGLSATILKVTGVAVAAVGALNMLGFGLKDVIFGLGKTLLISVPLIGALGAIGVGMYGLYRSSQKNIGGMGGVFSGLMDKVKLAWRGTIELISGGGFSEATKKSLQDAQNTGVAKFLVWMTGAIGRAKAFFGGMVDGFDAGLQRLDGPMQRFKGVLNSIFGFGQEGDPAGEMDRWSKSGERLGNRLADLSAWVLDLATNGLQWLRSAFENISLEKVEGGLRAIVTDFEAMASAIETVANAYQRLADFGTVWSGGFNADVSTLTPAEMLAMTNVMQGTEARKELEKEFYKLSEAKNQGYIDKYRERSGQELATQAAGITRGGAFDRAAQQIMGVHDTGNQGVFVQNYNANQNSILKEFAQMNRYLDIISKKEFGGEMRVDGQRLGDIVNGVSESRAEQDYGDEFALETVPMSVMR